MWWDEQVQRLRSKKKKERTRLFRDPFKFARKEKWKLEVTAQELEEHITSQLGDHENIPLGSPGHVPLFAEPESWFDITPTRWAKIRQVVDEARSASASGVNSAPYRVSARLLWKLMTSYLL